MFNSNPFNFYSPVNIIYGKGALNRLKDLKLPGIKAVIVTAGDGSMDAYAARVKSLLAEQNIDAAVFAEIGTNPDTNLVDRAAAFAAAQGCDFIVALGGGSSIDCSKGMAVVVKNGGKCWDYVVSGSGGRKPITNGALPIIAVPTTAGTGSEVSYVAVISNEATNEKQVIFSPLLFSKIAIIDPELTYTVPKHLTAFQGFDAFTHALEGLLIKKNSAVTDMYALEAIRLIGEYLPRAVENGRDEEARCALAAASNLAGIVLAQAGSSSEHPLEHALSAYFPRLPHGAGLATVFEAYYEEVIAQDTVNDKLTRAAKAMGLPVDGVSDKDGALCFLHAVVDMMKQIGLYQLDLTRFDVVDPDIDAMAELVSQSGTIVNADCWRLDKESLTRILTKSLSR